MKTLYDKCFTSEYGIYRIGDWYVVVQQGWQAWKNDHDHLIIGPFATSEEAVANGKLQTSGTPFIFQIRDREPK